MSRRLTADGQDGGATGDRGRTARHDRATVDRCPVMLGANHELLAPPGGDVIAGSVTWSRLAPASRDLAPPGGDVALASHAARAERRASARQRETGSDVIAEQVEPRVDRPASADNLAPAVANVSVSVSVSVCFARRAGAPRQEFLHGQVSIKTSKVKFR